MAKVSSEPTQYNHQAQLVINLQVAILLLLSIFSLCFYPCQVTIAILGGGVAVILPTICFAVSIFYKLHKRSVRAHLYCFYSGEMIKLMLNITLAFIMLVWLHFRVIPFLVGFLTTHFSIFLTPFFKKAFKAF